MSQAYVAWYGKERRQNWGTPAALFAKLHRRFRFTLDGASEPGNGLLPRSSTADAPISWADERVFCNPPWTNIKPFLDLAPAAELAVFLVPARPNARWFHHALKLGAKVEFFLGRPKFVKDGKPGPGSSPVDCLLLVFRRQVPPPEQAILSGIEGGGKA